jgi:hypothetical protein
MTVLSPPPRKGFIRPVPSPSPEQECGQNLARDDKEMLPLTPPSRYGAQYVYFVVEHRKRCRVRRQGGQTLQCRNRTSSLFAAFFDLPIVLWFH